MNRWQLLLGSALGIILFYLLGSLALDSGSLWHYLGTLLLLVVSIKLFVKSIATRKQGHN